MNELPPLYQLLIIINYQALIVPCIYTASIIRPHQNLRI